MLGGGGRGECKGASSLLLWNLGNLKQEHGSRHSDCAECQRRRPRAVLGEQESFASSSVDQARHQAITI